jgi:sugar O-acyltransferase (sialic acid O-acetyltransferase NeuD family)
MRPILIIGASGHAKVIIDAVEREARLRIAGVIDPKLAPGEFFLGYPRLGESDQDIPALVRERGILSGIVAIGDNWQRHTAARRIRELAPGFRLESCIHPASSIGRDVAIGAGTVVLAGAVLNADARVGELCIINTKASLDHDSVMDEGSSLAPGATVGGNTRIGAFSAIGLGANVLHNLSIGAHCVVGAGAAVIDDVDDGHVVVGVPARSVRARKPGDQYL